MAKKPLKFGSRKRFAEGGSDKYKAKYDRKVADIESDYKKAQGSKTGRAAEVAKAKYEQRMADAKDDLAKWTKSDRTQTRAAESAAERNLSLTRRYGSAEPKFDDKPIATPQAMPDADVAKLAATARQGVSDAGGFGSAFKAARSAGDKTFTWRGKSYTTQMASEKPKPAVRSAATTPARSAATTPARSATTTAARPAAAVTTPRPGPAVPVPGRAPAAAAPKPQLTQSERYRARAAELAAEAKREAAEEKATGSAGNRARFKNLFGFGSSAAERASKMYTRSADASAKQEQAARWRDVEAQAAKDADAYARAKRHAAIIAEGEKPGASGYARSTAKFYRENPSAMKKGGKVAKKAAPVKKYAKGGKIDGCAVRGMTKAKRAR